MAGDFGCLNMHDIKGACLQPWKKSFFKWQNKSPQKLPRWGRYQKELLQLKKTKTRTQSNNNKALSLKWEKRKKP